MSYELPTPDDLSTFIGSGESVPDENLQVSIDLAVDLLDQRLESAFREMPQSVYTEVVLELANAIYKRRFSTAGAVQFAFDGGTPVFDPKDLFNRVWPMVRMYVTPFPLSADEYTS